MYYIYSLVIVVIECRDIECPRGSQCKVYESTNQAYCQPSCDIDNGGCFTNQTCSLNNVTCQTPSPCPPVVQCSGL